MKRSFTIICDNCGHTQKFENGGMLITDFIEVDVTETCDSIGCEIDSIDFYCSGCTNEISI